MAEYVLGIDAGTESIRAGVYTPDGRSLAFGVSDNKNIHRNAGWAEQSIAQWDLSMVEAIKKAVDQSGVEPSQIRGIGLDGTSCTVVFLDESGTPLRDAVMWMDIRATKEAEQIASCGDDALKYVGFGNVSPEWFPCKVLWVKRHEPQTYERAATVFEQTDWMAYRLTGEITGNINTSTVRWFYNRDEGGFPQSLYRTIGLADVFEKLPRRIVELGEVVGGLTEEMAKATGLSPGIPVAGGGADAYMGVVGVNALEAGQLALITGSSQLHIGVADREVHTRGLFGSFPGALIPGLQIIEAGQISTGSVMKWFLTNFLSSEIKEEASKRGVTVYDILNEQAAKLPPGSDGVLVLEHWQGNRTPWVDPNSRGVIRGLTLSHGPAHIFRAIMEGVVYGTKVIIDRMEKEKFKIKEIIACGGATQSDLWMQITADVTGKPITIPEEQQAVSLGSAIAGAVGAGMYKDLKEAAGRMVRVSKKIEPDLEKTRIYAEYVRQYEATYNALKEESRRLVEYANSLNR
ncbi:MAG: FGGY-family carbohydrate kinase [Spirochaetaceae bacterium]